jgi:hypothetical protein
VKTVGAFRVGREMILTVSGLWLLSPKRSGAPFWAGFAAVCALLFVQAVIAEKRVQ